MYTPKIIITDDGSHTLSLEEMDETYHSTHGAINEAQYVYIQNGLKLSEKENIRVLEVGFGTGLNALLTLETLLKDQEIASIHYTTLEKFPLDLSIIEQLNYGNLISPSALEAYKLLHDAEWDKEVEIKKGFTLRKVKMDLKTDELKGAYDVVYYDAFAPSKQAEMWEAPVMKKITDVMDNESVLATYCAKGDVRRLLKGLGLKTKRTPGPPGKHEMLVARKE